MTIRPGRLSIAIAAMLALLLVGAVVDPRIAILVLLGDAALVAAVFTVGRRLRRLPIDVQRDGDERAQVDREQAVSFRIANRSHRTVVVRIRQPWPDGFEATGDTLEVTVAPGEVVRGAVVAKPRRRGGINLPPATFELRYAGADLAHVGGQLAAIRMRVFPSLRGMSAYEALRQHHASNLAGAHRHRMIGSGRDFDQLRDYVPDDDFRQVNWKATARRNRPITTVYQAERSQDVLLCLDCGRMMGHAMSGGSTALDHAIDASVMLAHVANRQGDRVGLVLFRDVVTLVRRPGAGMAAVNGMLEDLVDARAEPVFPSYGALTGALRAHQTRRSFVFLFTDLNDPQLAANLAEVLPLITRRHAVTVVSLRDPLLDEIASGPASDRRGVYDVLAARHMVDERAARVRELQRYGATVIEADADSITTGSINAYLNAKARQLV
ncbi:MAG TPA: DUF58 domain-containing protein [Tepidisphaeraceae bacterium]|nr:DUF58 domain-containing protein [Tepidisphaeraceae bacterium]